MEEPCVAYFGSEIVLGTCGWSCAEWEGNLYEKKQKKLRQYSSENELQEWIPRIGKASERAMKTLGYFNNCYHASAPENCLQSMQMLGNVTPEGSLSQEE